MNKFLGSDDYDNLRAMILWDGKTNDLGLHEVLEFIVQQCGLPAVLEELKSINQPEKEETNDE